MPDKLGGAEVLTCMCRHARHMEDGCSKRFDIRTLDLRAGEHGNPNTANRPSRLPSDHLTPAPAAQSSLPLGSGTRLPFSTTNSTSGTDAG